MKTINEQIIAKQDELIDIITTIPKNNDQAYYLPLKRKKLESELSTLKAQAEQESNNRQQSEGSANNLKTAEEILDKRINYQQNKNLYYYEVYSEVLQAIEEYAALKVEQALKKQRIIDSNFEASRKALNGHG